ncbi:hypothetical protein [Peribacillus frigoritolerans]|uniref:hypothetical protein n=1 Tax=Peribacillus frigoritolerans TaxID=450367 RepID=UPI00227E09FE|nr:hypothetical protein [Peribacillus frigoritolerans]MCY9141618.1 hypothetical protein [Peribacillus frigoritolerans]
MLKVGVALNKFDLKVCLKTIGSFLLIHCLFAHIKAVNAYYFTSKIDGGLSIIKFKTFFKGYSCNRLLWVN